MTASPNGLGTLRQKLLVLYAANSSPDTEVVAWSLYDGTSDETYEATGEAVPPYATVLDAMRDGWRVIKYPDLRPPSPGPGVRPLLPGVRIRPGEAGVDRWLTTTAPPPTCG